MKPQTQRHRNDEDRQTDKARNPCLATMLATIPNTASGITSMIQCSMTSSTSKATATRLVAV